MDREHKTRFKVFHLFAMGDESDTLEDRLNEWWTDYSQSWKYAEIVAMTATAGMVVVAYKSEEEDIEE